MQKKHPTLTVASVLAVLIPLFYTFSWTLKSGELPSNDYWGIVSQFYSVNGFSPNPLDWLVRSNEHFVLVPSIIYASNILITKGSNLGLSFIAVCFALIQTLLLIALLPSSFKRYSVVYVLLILCIAAFSFTPAAAHNWMRGFSGVVWIGANMFVTASIFCLSKLIDNKHLCWAISSIIFGVFGCLTYSTALALWPVLYAAVVLMRLQIRIVLLYISFAILVGCIFLLFYKTPSYHPALSDINIISLLAYIPVYLGAIFTLQTNTALSIGIVGLVMSIGFISYWLMLKPNLIKATWLPWIAVQTYALLNALMAAVSRSGFGLEQARASRYASLPSLFWISLVIVIVLCLQQLQINQKQYRFLLIPVFAVFTVLILLTYRVGTATAQTVASKAALQPLVALSFQLGTPDIEIIKAAGVAVSPRFLKVIDTLKVNNLVPFNRDVKHDNFCTDLEQKVNPELLNAVPQSSPLGFFDRITQMTPTVVKVEGWSGNSGSNVKCIAIVNQDNIVRGFAMNGFQRLDVARALGSEYEFSGWKGYAQISPEDRQLAAYGLLKNHKEWIILRKSHKL